MPTTSSWIKRQAGILLPVSSLPSKYGMGSMGKAAREWVDFLAAAHQRCWQGLPMGPTGFGNSPYQSFSAFAGDPLYIDLELLAEDDLIGEKALKRTEWGTDPGRVDYDVVRQGREPLLRKAFGNFKKHKALSRFRKENAAWVEDYALFMALKSVHDGKPWSMWEEGVRLRKPAAMKKARADYAKEIDYHVFTQYLFFQQWEKLKKYANKRDISIIGDMPIYVSGDSADVWANPGQFQLDEDNVPTQVAGCPPDAFSADGQLWGNPIYRWDQMKEDGYTWWIACIKAKLSMFDVLRIDHFRGFESYWSVPYGDETARGGKWVKGPGNSFIQAINQAVPGAPIIAEDLGYLTPAVKALLKRSGYPGMKVLHFAFTSWEDSSYLPHNYGHHCVVYTGTHDNDTTLGWIRHAPAEDLEMAQDYLGFTDEKIGLWAFIRAALTSVGDLAIIPMQDYLELGSEARMNTPSTVSPMNWSWRMEKGAANKKLAKKIARLTDICGRSKTEEKNANQGKSGKKAKRKKSE